MNGKQCTAAWQVPQRHSAPLCNPFATRYVRPGAIDYVFPPGESLDALLKRFEAYGRQGQIVGPHGTGKSTLLALLHDALETAGFELIHFELHDGQRRLPRPLKTLAVEPLRSVLLVDGYEQLGWPSRAALRWFCRRRRCGLIVTSHRSMGLPTLAHTRASLPLAQELVRRLQQDDHLPVTPQQVQQAYDHHAGNLREMFFELYDRYQEQCVLR